MAMSERGEDFEATRPPRAGASAWLARLAPLRGLTLTSGRPALSVAVVGRDGHSRLLNLNLRHPLLAGALLTLVLAITGGAFALGLSFGRGTDTALARSRHWMNILVAQREQLDGIRARMQARARALAIQVGGLQADMLRLDALGQRLTAMAGLSPRTFDFRRTPALGGPDTDAPGAQPGMPSIAMLLGRLQDRINLRRSQLAALENVILSRKLHHAIHPEGRPVRVGWISSPFGWRLDPFTGAPEFHEGIDFAAPRGTPIHAVAAGVVVSAGPEDGFGNIVQIKDGDGFSTLYAHAQRVLVHVGDTVQRGEVIALVGSTGYSTGPHVHFEVLRYGRAINPSAFIGQHALTVAQVIKGG
jgi:murein DD-endopeptidase MepM/ murein hydrolase activator NlpD